MASKKMDLKLVGIILVVAVSISIAVILIGEAAGFPKFGVERVSQVLCFGVFVGVYRATRRRSVPA